MAELCELEKSHGIFPACLMLLVKVLVYDTEIGSLNTLNSILDLTE
jgi:hypothetical protein